MKKFLLIVLQILTIALLVLMLSSFAFETKFDIGESVDRQDSIIEARNIKKLKSHIKNDDIYSYDVNDKGEVVLAFYGNTRSTAVVYDKDGVFLFGFEFDTNGTFVAEWSSNGVNVIDHRSDYILNFDRNGECLSVSKIANTEKNVKFDRYLESKDEKTVGEYKYRLLSSAFFKDGKFYVPQRLIRIDADGTEHIVYEANGSFLSSSSVFIIVFLIIFAVVVISSRNRIGRNKKIGWSNTR